MDAPMPPMPPLMKPLRRLLNRRNRRRRMSRKEAQVRGRVAGPLSQKSAINVQLQDAITVQTVPDSWASCSRDSHSFNAKCLIPSSYPASHRGGSPARRSSWCCPTTRKPTLVHVYLAPTCSWHNRSNGLWKNGRCLILGQLPDHFQSDSKKSWMIIISPGILVTSFQGCQSSTVRCMNYKTMETPYRALSVRLSKEISCSSTMMQPIWKRCHIAILSFHMSKALITSGSGAKLSTSCANRYKSLLLCCPSDSTPLLLRIGVLVLGRRMLAAIVELWPNKQRKRRNPTPQPSNPSPLRHWVS